VAGIDRYREFDSKVAKRIALVGGVCSLLIFGPLFGLGFAPGWASGWGSWRMGDVYSWGMALGISASAFGGTVAVAALAGRCVEKSVRRAYIGWGTFVTAVAMSATALVILLPGLVAAIRNDVGPMEGYPTSPSTVRP
jgi:hypothetical protein